MATVTRLLLQRARRVFGLALMDTRCDSERMRRHSQDLCSRTNPLESVIRGDGDKAPVAAGSARVRPRPHGYSPPL